MSESECDAVICTLLAVAAVGAGSAVVLVAAWLCPWGGFDWPAWLEKWRRK